MGTALAPRDDGTVGKASGPSAFPNGAGGQRNWFAPSSSANDLAAAGSAQGTAISSEAWQEAAALVREFDVNMHSAGARSKEEGTLPPRLTKLAGEGSAALSTTSWRQLKAALISPPQSTARVQNFHTEAGPGKKSAEPALASRVKLVRRAPRNFEVTSAMLMCEKFHCACVFVVSRCASFSNMDLLVKMSILC